MDPHACPLPVGQSPPPSEQALPATLKQLLGIGEQELVPDASRRSNTLIFTVIGTLTLLVFGVANVRAGQDHRLMVMGVVQLLEVAFLLVPAIILVSRRAPPVLSENMLVLAGFAIFASNAVFGGQTGDAPYWTFVFPYLVFFLRGQKTGWLVGLAFAVLVPCLMLYSSRYWDFWVYDDAHALYYGLAYFFNVVTAAYFNLLRSRFQAHLADQVEYHTGEVRKHVGTLQHNALHDLSTGLLNRQGLTERLDSSLAVLSGGGGFLLVAHVRFFRVPELASIVGSAKVDESLGQLGRVLQQHLTGLVGLARIGQDTLGVVLQSDTADASAVQQLRAIAHLRNVTHLSEFAVHVEMALGVAVQRLGEASDAEVLMRNAEQALLFAVDHRLDHQFFDALLHKHFVDRNRRYEKLREAILHNTLMLHYQPQVDLKTGLVVGAEALARWNDPQEGMVPPDKFIPIIESTGLLHRFSVWTVARALRDCSAWQTRLPGVSVSINLSAEALHDPEVLQTVEQHLMSSGLSPALVVMELTESVLLTSPETALDCMARFVALGVKLSIDDYGAGFSSLTYLKQLPAQEMKIDKSFMENLAEGSKDRAIVLSSIELGHDLGLKVLAEGIEDEATCNALRDAGCDLGQGWWFAKAMPSADFENWTLARNSAATASAPYRTRQLMPTSTLAPAIQWPAHFHPDHAPVHVVNDLFIPAPAEHIWAWLIRAPLWPTWYANSKVDWAAGRSRDLALGLEFEWKTFGVHIRSCVQEFVPCERIAWNGIGLGAEVYHAWLIIPQAGGCRVLTEETQHGWGARLMHFFMPYRMYDGHALWLESLSIQATGGMPPAL